MCSDRKSLLANRISSLAFLAGRQGTTNNSLSIHSLAGRTTVLDLNVKASLKHHCPSLTVIPTNVLGQSKTEEEVNSIAKWHFTASSFSHLSPDQEEKVCDLLGADENRGPQQGPGQCLHFKADEQTLRMLRLKFQSAGPPESGSTSRCSPEQ